VLTNAVYFNAAWTERFNEDRTADAPFHLSVADSVDGPQSKTVKMMQQQERLGYLDAGDFDVVSLPYALGRASMLILVPKKIDGIADVERWLTEKSVADLPGKLKTREVALSLPRIKMEQSASLVPVLKRMGMTLAFDPGQADFSGMSESERLMITDVLHKAYVKVDEKGTEAAAATGVVMGVTAMPMPEEPVVVRADRPFVMIIREQKTGAILFMGRIMDPG
jgi:serpin B